MLSPSSPQRVVFRRLRVHLLAREGAFVLGSEMTMADLAVCTLIDTIAGGCLDFLHPSVLDDFKVLKTHAVAVHSSPLFLKYNSAFST